MSMHIDTARAWLDDDELPLTAGQRTADAIRTVLERLAELEAGEVAHEWGVRWPESDVWPVEEARDPERAARAARSYGGHIVRREVRRGPWTEAS